MRQLYVIGAILATVLLIAILGYKVVSYSKDINQLQQDKKDLKDELVRKDNDIQNLKKANSELAQQYQGLSNERTSQTPKVITVEKIVEVEKTKCDNDPIGPNYINGLRQVLSSN